MSTFLNGAYHATGNGYWNTPPHLKEQLYAEFDFDFDPCPETPSKDGLKVEWGQRNFCNPPFHDTPLWVNKILEEQRKGKMTVLLIPARTDTAYFHEKILPNADTIRFIRGRLRFVSQDGKTAGASPWPSILCIFQPRTAEMVPATGFLA